MEPEVSLGILEVGVRVKGRKVRHGVWVTRLTGLQPIRTRRQSAPRVVEWQNIMRSMAIAQWAAA